MTRKDKKARPKQITLPFLGAADLLTRHRKRGEISLEEATAPPPTKKERRAKKREALKSKETPTP